MLSTKSIQCVGPLSASNRISTRFQLIGEIKGYSHIGYHWSSNKCCAEAEAAELETCHAWAMELIQVCKPACQWKRSSRTQRFATWRHWLQMDLLVPSHRRCQEQSLQQHTKIALLNSSTKAGNLLRGVVAALSSTAHSVIALFGVPVRFAPRPGPAPATHTSPPHLRRQYTVPRIELARSSGRPFKLHWLSARAVRRVSAEVRIVVRRCILQRQAGTAGEAAKTSQAGLRCTCR
jgi:hypothetical protein